MAQYTERDSSIFRLGSDIGILPLDHNINKMFFVQTAKEL